ncbi:MAG: cyclic nucleotide-binding domain-containing protein [Deltaproteobacteria bacterium]|nr:cyclic nucleotide-binding domain-containing protein [Deltaproteobacteria bacterium]
MFVKEVQLFKGIPSHIMDEIVKLIVEEEFPGGHVFHKRGDYAESMYILEEGVVEIVVEGKERVSIPLDQPGYVFGWSALVEPYRYTATVKCVKDSKVIKLDGDRLMRLFEQHSAEGLTIMKRLAGVMASRLDTIYQRVSSF